MANGRGREFLDRQLGYLAAGDVEGLVLNNYKDDASIVTFDQQARGRDALKAHLAGFLEMAGKVTPKRVEKFVETGDLVLAEITADLEKLGTVTFVDAFVLEGDRIACQFSIIV